MRFIGVMLAAGSVATLGGALASCATTEGAIEDIREEVGYDEVDTVPGQTAYASMSGTDGMDHGRAILSEESGELKVSVRFTGIPAGTHAVHIHTTGDCSAADFTSAGGHWNPTDEPHPQHKGDLGNAAAGTDGTITESWEVDNVSLTGGNIDLLDSDGAALIVHAGADDMVSQPSGNAGARIACGVVTMG